MFAGISASYLVRVTLQLATLLLILAAVVRPEYQGHAGVDSRVWMNISFGLHHQMCIVNGKTVRTRLGKLYLIAASLCRFRNTACWRPLDLFVHVLGARQVHSVGSDAIV
jgi:hypothetical protein